MESDVLTLAGTQHRALDALLAAAQPGKFVVLVGGPGKGKSTLLAAARRRLGGTVLGAAEMQAEVAKHPPLAIEDALSELVSRALDANSVVFLDDFHLTM